MTPPRRKRPQPIATRLVVILLLAVAVGVIGWRAGYVPSVWAKTADAPELSGAAVPALPGGPAGAPRSTRAEAPASAQQPAGTTTKPSGPTSAVSGTGTGVAVPVAQLADTRALVLVNADHGVTTHPGTASLVSAWPKVPVINSGVRLSPATLRAVTSLFAAASQAGVGGFYVSSGYRTFAAQQRLYDAAAEKSHVQPPSHSEHETGLAVDIMAVGVAQADLGGSPQGRWLADQAWKYGLILRYPAGKQGVTGIAAEPWHFRYVGTPHASYCHQHGLTLEEYIAALQRTGGYTVTLGTTTYDVRYEHASGGALRVPAGLDHTVSSDNTGGYIVTSWK